jgi:hypothetical protein
MMSSAAVMSIRYIGFVRAVEGARRLPFMALLEPYMMSDLSLECAPKRTSADHS